MRRVAAYAHTGDAVRGRSVQVEVVEARGALHDAAHTTFREARHDRRISAVIHEQAYGVEAVRQRDRVRIELRGGELKRVTAGVGLLEKGAIVAVSIVDENAHAVHSC